MSDFVRDYFILGNKLSQSDAGDSMIIEVLKTEPGYQVRQSDPNPIYPDGTSTFTVSGTVWFRLPSGKAIDVSIDFGKIAPQLGKYRARLRKARNIGWNLAITSASLASPEQSGF
jgi:hypothetical protein